MSTRVYARKFTTTALCGAAAFVALSGQGCPNFPFFNNADKPKISPVENLTVECGDEGQQAELEAWLDSATFSGGCGGGTITHDFEGITPDCGEAGSVVVTWTVTDDCGNTSSASATFTIADTTEPTLSVPEPISVTCGEPDTAEMLLAWLDDATAEDTCGGVAITTERSLEPGQCTATITWTATDECGNATSLSSTYTTEGDTEAPEMTLLGDAALTIECGSDWQDPGVDISDDCDALIQPLITGNFDPNTPGEYVLTYAAIDACGNEGPVFTRTVTVVDTTPPVVTLKETIKLWPPNHRMETLTLADLATAEDACEGELDLSEAGAIIDIYSDEPDNSTGDGNTTNDIVIVDNHTFQVRAERKGNSNGRVYGIRFEVSDSSGNTVETTAFVHVPHDQSGREAVDNGPAAGHTVTR